MVNKISKSTAYMVDLLCEGEIEGPAEATWDKSTYFNETLVRNSDNTYNFDGTIITGREGVDSHANYLSDFNTGDVVLAETIVDVEMTNAGGATARSITDDEVDHVDITFSFPQGLFAAYDSGKQKALPITISISVTPTNGYEQTIISNHTISKYARSEFRQQFTISNLSQYLLDGDDAFPIVVKVYKTSADRVSSAEATYADQIKWYSFTEKKEVKLQYRNRAVVATELKAEDFGDNIPQRAWKIKGKKVNVYTGYDFNDGAPTWPETWDGTFKVAKEYTDDPGLVVYDLLIDKRYGLGIDPDQVDKWALYAISKYCATLVTYNIDARQSDGSYVNTPTQQKRFTFNGVISNREQALKVINHFCSVFRGFPMWTNGLVTFGQDSPGTMSRVVGNSNVVDGQFDYEGTSKRQRTTAIKVGWNDPDNFGKRDFVTLEDRDGIVDYGYNPFEFYAIGCNNRNEAILRGKLALYTNINQTEIVSFAGGLEWADAMPGDIIGIQDQDYAGENWNGRIISSTTTSITIDHSVTIAGATYTVWLQTAEGDAVSRELNNSPGATTTLTWLSTLSDTITNGTMWIVSSTVLAIREFRIMSVKEADTNKFDISAYEYSDAKYDVVEGNLYPEEPIPTTQPVGVLTPPSNFAAETFTYVDGENGNRKYGVHLDWTASDDVRVEYYDIDYAFYDGVHVRLDETADNAYDWLDVNEGSYDFYLRAHSLTNTSKWLSATNIEVSTVVSGILPPANLRVYGTVSDTDWEGPDCHIEWDASPGVYYNDTLVSGTESVSGYKIEIRKPDTTLVGTYQVEADTTNFRYTREMNIDDFKQRVILIYVYTIDVYGEYSVAYDSESFSNTAPAMGGAPTRTNIYSGAKIDWTNVKPSDTDGEKFVVWMDTSNPPTTQIAEVAWDTTVIYPTGFDTDLVYYAAITPYDGFGAGSKSASSAAIEPLKVAEVDIDAELSSSIEMTDSLGTTPANMLVLLDRVIDSGGIAYGSSAWVNYNYGIEYFQERIKVYVNTGCNVYVTTTKIDDSQQWFAGDAGHDEDANGYMTSYGSAGAAATGYFTLSAGKNVLTFPQNVISREVKLTFVSGATLYELGPGREVIADEVVADNLSALSADLGTVTAGLIQSADWGSSEGFLIDLDTKDVVIGGSSSPKLEWDNSEGTLDIVGSITIQGGSGVSNLTDAGGLATQDRGDLDYTDGADNTAANETFSQESDIDVLQTTNAPAAAGADVTSANTANNASNYTGNTIATGYTAAKATDPLADQTSANTSADTTAVAGTASATVRNQAVNGNSAYGTVTTWKAPADTTKIDGGDLYVGSSIQLSDPGKLTVGNQNIILDSGSDTITVAPDGGIYGNDYCALQNGDLTFFYWDGSKHVTYKSVRKTHSGLIPNANGAAVTLPGIWREAPEIMLFPNSLELYMANRYTQTQTMVLDTGSIVRSGVTWIFYPKAQLVLGAGSGGQGGFGPINQISTTSNYGTAPVPSNHWIGGTVTCSPAQSSVSVSGNTHSWKHHSTTTDKDVRNCWYNHIQWRIRLYVNGGWVATTGVYDTSRTTGARGWSVGYTGSVSNWRVYYEYRAIGSNDRCSNQDCVSCGLGTRGGMYTSSYVTSSTGGIPGATVLANGSLKYIAVGN